jgi:hypothetical protein
MFSFKIVALLSAVGVAVLSAFILWWGFPPGMKFWFRITLLAILIVPLAAAGWIYNTYARVEPKRGAADGKATQVGEAAMPFNFDDDRDLETALTYYDYFRDEIKREDEITHQRVTWTMTFQGFIISALTLLLILNWDGSKNIEPIGRLALFAFGFIGVAIGLISFMGILASRRSIKNAVGDWEKKDAKWGLLHKYVPQAYGQGNAWDGGDNFAVLMPALFILMWTLFLSSYFIFSYFDWIQPCLGGGEIFRCMFVERPTAGSIKFELRLP